MKRANTMSTITVELTIKVKTKFTSSNAENIQWIHLTTDVGNFHSNPTHQKQRRAKQPRKRQQQQPKANRNPRHHKDTTQEAHRPKDTGHKGTTRSGRSKQAQENGQGRNQENIRPIVNRQDRRPNETRQRKEMN